MEQNDPNDSNTDVDEETVSFLQSVPEKSNGEKRSDMTWLRENAWYSLYLPSSWLSNIGHGLMVTVLGPTQPYLAQNVGVEIDVINLVWSFGFLGYIGGALATGFIYKRYLV